MESYPCRYRLDGEERWLIHFSNDEDGVVVDGARRVVSFATAAALESFARKKRVKLQAEQHSVDFDALRRWLDAPGAPPDCRALYAAWNLLGDVADSVGRGERFSGYARRYQPIKEELLWGCNLPGAWAMEEYTPEFGDYETAMLRDVLDEGMELLRERMVRV